MHHLLRGDSRGMLSIPEALWLREQDVPEPPPPRHRIAVALVALAIWLAPSVTRKWRERPAPVRAT